MGAPYGIAIAGFTQQQNLAHVARAAEVYTGCRDVRALGRPLEGLWGGPESVQTGERDEVFATATNTATKDVVPARPPPGLFAGCTSEHMLDFSCGDLENQFDKQTILGSGNV